MSGKKVNIAQGGMRGEAKKTKVVFKNVLDTPFNIQWPEVTADNNTIVLDTVCDMVKPIRDYHNTRPKQDAKLDKKQKKTSAKDTAGSVSSKPSTALATLTSICSSAAASEPMTESTAESTAPTILKSTILGINAITKALERSIQDLAAHPPPTAIILCKGDLIPSHLYAHLGPMIAMLPGVLLFPLLRGSERRLSEALGLPAVGALAIQSTEGSREAEDLIMILKGMVEPMAASWLPKVTLKPVAKDKVLKQRPKGAPISEAGAGTVSSTAPAPVSTSGQTTEAPKPAPQQAEFIATSIKTIKTTMPIIVKTPKPAQTDNSTTNNNNNNKGRGQGQQQQQQKQKHQQNQSQSHNQNSKQKQQQQQVNQGKNKKPPVESLDGDRGQGKKAKIN